MTYNLYVGGSYRLSYEEIMQGLSADTRNLGIELHGFYYVDLADTPLIQIAFKSEEDKNTYKLLGKIKYDYTHNMLGSIDGFSFNVYSYIG